MLGSAIPTADIMKGMRKWAMQMTNRVTRGEVVAEVMNSRFYGGSMNLPTIADFIAEKKNSGVIQG